jgi:hypothetical protein
MKRVQTVADSGRGWDYHYAGWYQRLLGLAEAGWLPVVLRNYVEVVYDRTSLDDVRPREWQVPRGEKLNDRLRPLSVRNLSKIAHVLLRSNRERCGHHRVSPMAGDRPGPLGRNGRAVGGSAEPGRPR